METVEELKRYVRFLYSSLQEKDRENRQVRDEMAEIKAKLKAANRRADSEEESRQRLFDKLERFMDSQKETDDAKIKSLQSDGYNVYMYLDDEMVDVEHICCLAHVHNKLQEAKRLGIFNTFISTCQQKCRNFRDFFVDYVREWNRGRRDYDNLVRLAFSPATN